TSALVASKVVQGTPRIFRAGDAGIAIAEETGAGTLISGSYYMVGDSLRFQLAVTDVAERRMRRAVGPVTGARADPTRVVPVLALRTSGALASTIDTASKWWSQPPSLEAYRAMMTGW